MFERIWENTNQECYVHRGAQVKHPQSPAAGPSELPPPIRQHHNGCAIIAEREHEQVVQYYL